jgi:hypothetical protein
LASGRSCPGLVAGAQDDVLVGDVLVRVGLGLGAVDGVERGLLVPGVVGPDDLLDRAELELGGGPDGGDHVVGVGHVGDGHHDVAALDADLDSATPLELTRLRMMSTVVSSCSLVGAPPRGLVGRR